MMADDHGLFVLSGSSVRKGRPRSTSETGNRIQLTSVEGQANVKDIQNLESPILITSDKTRRQSSGLTVIEFSPQRNQDCHGTDRKRRSRLMRVGTLRSKRDIGSISTLDPSLLARSDQWSVASPNNEKVETEAADTEQRVTDYALEQFHLLVNRYDCPIPKQYPYKKKREAASPDGNSVIRSPSTTSSLFGSPLSFTRSKEHFEHIPNVSQFLTSALEWIEKNGLYEEGIFRKAGNLSRIRQLRHLLEIDPATVIWENMECSPIEVANLVKQYIREMPEPLTTFRDFHLFIGVTKFPSNEVKIAALQILLLALRRSHRDILVGLLGHLYLVQDKQQENKMDAHNLAVVFGPNLFPEQREKSLDQSMLNAMVDITEFMILNHAFISQPPEKFLEHAEQYVKPRSNVMSSLKRMIVHSIHDDEEKNQLDAILLQLTNTKPGVGTTTILESKDERETTKLLEAPRPEVNAPNNNTPSRAVIRVDCHFNGEKSSKSHIATEGTTAGDIIKKTVKCFEGKQEHDFVLFRMGAKDTVLARIYNDTKLLPLIRDDPSLTLCIRYIQP